MALCGYPQYIQEVVGVSMQQYSLLMLLLEPEPCSLPCAANTAFDIAPGNQHHH